MERKEVYKVIDGERDYQDIKWAGTRSDNEPGEGALDRTIDEYAAYIQGYSNELINIVSHSDDKFAKLDAVRKIAALCVACMESNGARERDLNFDLPLDEQKELADVKTDMEKFNNFLISIANLDGVGIRRKMLKVKQVIDVMGKMSDNKV